MTAASGGPAAQVDEVVVMVQAAVAGTEHEARVAAIAERLRGPLRVALAGRVKAGKSTLLNALVGERLAPTDAGECTTLVTWYERADQYRVLADLRDGTTSALPFRRADGALQVDLAGRDPAQVSMLHVGWPSSALTDITFIDTPGLASLHDEHSARTRDFLAVREASPRDADAVVFLMRHVHRVDLAFLDAFMDRTVVGASPVNALAVLARADEIGAGRIDAMASAGRIAARYAADPEVRTLCSSVVPLAGLLAETGLTFREDEASALRVLASTDPDVLDEMLLSASQFCELEASDLTVEVRRGLLDRLGLFGIRVAVRAVLDGSATSGAALAQFLVEQSGLPALRRLIADTFLPRASVLKARSCLQSLHLLAADVAAGDPALSQRILREVERIEVGTVEFARLRAAHLVATGSVEVMPGDVDDLRRTLMAVTAHEAVGVDAEADAAAVRAAALPAIARWRAVAGDPLQPPLVVEAYEAAARTCEAIYARA